MVVHCKREPYDIYVGRPHRSIPKAHWGILGNPFPITTTFTREQSIERFKVYAEERMRIDPVFAAAVRACKDRRLGCWCSPKSCHGDVLLELSRQSFV